MKTLKAYDLILILFHGKYNTKDLAEEIDFQNNTFTMPFYRLN